MERVRLDLWAFDVGAVAADAEEFAAAVSGRVSGSWDAGADLVVLPEFTWLGLERFVSGPARVRGVAGLFWGELWPGVSAGLGRPGKAAVLGTVPAVGAGGLLFNRAPIVCEGRVFHQDKLHLTPWEREFEGGGPLRVWEFCGVRVAVVICLDIEIPEIAAALRGRSIDLLLVPSATESMLGVERVGRCAEARAVELGCFVAVCPLLGGIESELVDANVGRLAVFSPSQSPFAAGERRVVGEPLAAGCHRMAVDLDIGALRRARGLTGETDPSRVRVGEIEVEVQAG